jgi:hypothetical protein
MDDLREEVSNAIKRIQVGIPGRVDDLFMGCHEKGNFHVCYGTRHYLENITKEQVIEELSYIKTKTHQLIEISDDFRNLTANKKITYIIDSDYGKGGITICKMLDDKITWLFDIDR